MPDAPLLKVACLRKSYSVPVLIDFDFELLHGEVHALVGGNGAGKSTFARVLCGLTQPDTGRIELEGAIHAPATVREAESAGVIMVLQELNLIRTLSVAENLFLHRLPHRGGFVDFKTLREEARKALARVGLERLDPTTLAEDLGVGHQQLVEIARGLAQDCRLLILDEPTAALTDPEINLLFDNIRRLQAQRVGIIYISHRMDEIRRIADRVTVLRDGRHVATHPAAGTTPAGLIREMVGHDLPARGVSAEKTSGDVLLRVSQLCAGDRVQNISFEVRSGEIVGLAGLVGAGRTETLRAIFGADTKTSGEVFVGKDAKRAEISCPSDAVRVGIGMIPEDRQHQGLLLPQSILVNTTLSTIPEHARHGWINSAAETATAEQLSRRMEVRSAGVEQPVRELSGGNQQKVVISRWLARDCRVLLFDEPTRGIDAGAKDSIYRLLHDLAAEGKALVVVSSELQELLAICDRILVLSAGRLVAEFHPPDWSQEQITKAAFSGHLEAANRSP